MKVFGCRPHVGRATGTGAGVRQHDRGSISGDLRSSRLMNASYIDLITIGDGDADDGNGDAGGPRAIIPAGWSRSRRPRW